jgi:hypothetical protein
LAGVSQDGRNAVLARTQQRSTTFVIVSPVGERTVRLGGNRWSFDALSGDNLFLVRTLPSGYQIRLLRLASGVLERKPLKDPDESATHFGAAAIAPDGERLAVADGYHVWFVELAQRKVLTGPSHVALALVYSPDLKRLWVVGERSCVSALRAR